ncbi:MAG: L,D-transpeptidase family protein [Gemmatimonadaceae bacterium]
MMLTIHKYLVYALALAMSALAVTSLPARALPLQGAPKTNARAKSGASPKPNPLAVQVMLARAGVSVGEIDGRLGPNTSAALRSFQRTRGLNPNGVADAITWRALRTTAGAPTTVRIRVTAKDLSGPYIKLPAAPRAFARRRCACFASSLEALAERYHAAPALLQRLNPRMRWRAIRAGDVLVVPNVLAPVSKKVHAVRVVVDARDVPVVEAFDSTGVLLFHAPATVGAAAADSATPSATAARIVWRPKYQYRPAMFGDRRPGARTLTFPSGPNSPVGSVWIGLNQPHVGIHGTSEPSRIGRDTSHGCVRLTNWDAVRLASILKLGAQVEFRRGVQVADGPDAKYTNQSLPSHK